MNERAGGRAEWGFLQGLLGGLLAIALLVAVFAALAVEVGWFAGVGGVVVTAVIVAGFGLVRGSGTLAAGALFGMIAAFLAGFSITEYSEARRGATIRDVPVAEAATRGDATVFYFSGARLRLDCEGDYLSTTRDGRTGSHHYAVPVVSPSAAEQDPVAVWAVCEDWGDCRANWRQPFNAGLRRSGFTDDFRQAVAAAQSRCGLVSRPDAALIEWVASPEAAIEQRRADFWFAVQTWTMVYLVVACTVQAVLVRRRRSEARASMPL